MNDLRLALRSLAKSPGFTTLVVLTLALGIGLVTIQFSLVNGVLYKGLPFERSERLMVVEQISPGGRGRATSAAEFQSWREQQKSFQELGAQRGELLELSGEAIEPRSLRGAALSSGILNLLHAQPALGRGFTLADEQPGAPTVVLLGHALWRDHFGADPRVVGRAIRMRGKPATIVGVMPEGFAYPVNESVWTNLPLPAPGTAAAADSMAVQVVGRLSDQSTLAAARAEFELLVRRTGELSPASDAAETRARIVPLTETLNPDAATIVLYSLLGVVGGVLTLACLNVSNLLSARALQHGHELAIRSALGATRGRIVRQLLVESLLLSGAGAVGGLLLATWIVPLIDRAMAVASRPFWVVIDIDHAVLAATAALTLAVGVLSGLFPALRATRRGASAMLKEAAGGTSHVGLGRINRSLVVAQVGMSCAVLIATSVLVAGARKLGTMEVPYDDTSVLSGQIRLRGPEWEQASERMQFHRALLDRLTVLPGVQSASLTASFPFSSAGSVPVETRNAPAGGRLAPAFAFVNAVSPGFFRVLNVSLRSGREFTEADGPDGERVAVVSESFARRTWPGESALGQHVRLNRGESAGAGPWLKVVGVVADLPLDRPERRHGIHVPLAQQPPAEAVVLLGSTGDPRILARPLRDAVRLLSADVPVDRVLTLAERTADDLRLITTLSRLALTFGVSGLLLAAIGVYGVTAFAVQRRTREFGLRMALGARPGDVLRYVMRRGLRQCAVGLGAGGLVGWAAGRPLLSVTGTVLTPPGPAFYLATIVCVGAAVLFALWLPARRATRVNPIDALRAE